MYIFRASDKREPRVACRGYDDRDIRALISVASHSS